MSLALDTKYLKGFIKDKDINALESPIEKAHNDLINKTGKGSEFTGWVDLPSTTSDQFLDQLKMLGDEIRAISDCLISIGIGGSYVGIHAAVEFLIGEQKLPIHFAGHNLSSGHLYYLLERLKDKRVSVVVISKSGTTTEPALAFRIVKKFMQQKYQHNELKKRIICITDQNKGALRQVAQREGYRSFEIQEDVGGRFSVLAPAGLVPLAIAGINVRGLIEGAREAELEYNNLDLDKNNAYRFAAARYLLYKQGKKIEVLSTFYERLSFVEEWWKQLFGESEGKDGKGIFPASLSFTTDLHSMGQLLQEGERNMFETFLLVKDSGHELMIPKEEGDVDNFNCVAGRDLDYVNKQAYEATASAHYTGGVPSMTLTIPRFDAYCLGHLFYFFERTVAMTGYLMGVNPFNQPGVEAYKSKMFELLGRS
jgi:glucose-6-phosphate isomerase